ncbi:MAG TPA: YSC84-related protein [Gammaproteobacteria bacterium]|nr:YSC84-related protein [Gammaproteobacteria bacterium]
MFRRHLIIGVLALAVFSTGPSVAQEKDKQAQKIEKQKADIDKRADQTLQKLFKEVEGSKALYDKSAGYAVISVTKAGFFVSGAGGSGVAIDKATKAKTYMKMGSAGAGFTFGADRFDMVFMFQTKERLANFISGGWDSAAGAKATAGSSSAGAASDFFEGQKIFQLGDKGLMASADVTGTKYWADEDLNKK